MSSSPDNWASCELGEISDVVGGGTPPSKDVTNFETHGGIPWITPADLSGYKQQYITRGARNLSSKGFAACSAVMLPEDAVLFSSRAPVGYVVIAANPVCTNQGFKSLVFPREINSRFVYYYLKFIKPLAEEQATGTTFKELSGKAMAKLPMLLAPANEQKRIADKLDVVLARVDACRERLDRVPDILKRFRQSVLAAATSGKLTEEWREEHAATEWRRMSVQDIAIEVFDGPFGSHLKSKDYSEEGIRVVRLENIGWLHFVGEKETFISKEKFQTLRKHTLKGRDVLISSFIAEEVRVCLLPTELSERAINKADCFCVRTDPNVCNPHFLALRLACRSTFSELEKLVHGATRPRINLRQLKEFKFDLPSVAEQEEIVCRVDSLFEFDNRLNARYATAYSQVESLTPALLAKAFRGELVAQDPRDEPAAVLVERIRALRGAAGRLPRLPKARQATTEVRELMQKLLDVLAAAKVWLSAEEAFRRCGVSDGAQTDRVEELYTELRQLDKAGTIQVRRVGDIDELRLEPKA